jgi:hypothetical protein
MAEALVWAGVLLCAAGFAATRMWEHIPAGRVAETLLIAGLAALPAWALRRLAGWSWASALALVLLLAAVVMAGVLSSLAVALLACAACAVGGWIAGPARPLAGWLAGMALLATTLGWTLPLPVHSRWTWLAVLLLPVVLRWRALLAQYRQARDGWRVSVAASPRAAAWTVVALGLASAGTWPPTMQFDDLAYHLGLPWQLMLHGRYALDVSQQAWALAPWAGDALQAIPQLVAGVEARGPLNLAWLAATAAGLWRLGALLGLVPAMRWATVALYASLPLTTALLGGMQTETPAVAVTVALAVLVLDDTAPRRLLLGALLYGLLFALKPMHGIAATPLVLWALWRQRRDLPAPGAFALAVLAFAAVGGSSYAYAWAVTGNPVLPLLNDVFRSPAFPAAGFNDTRWQQGLDVALPWSLTFDTANYLEGWDGALGFVLVALSGAWLLALPDRRARGLAICATLAIALPLLPLQYARYLHPGIAMLLPALVLALQRALPRTRAGWLVAGLCVLNFLFQANAYWLLHLGAIKRAFLAAGADAPLFERYAPERALLAAIRERAPDSGPVLLLSHPFHAELAGRGRTAAWYSPHWHAAAERADADASGAAWAALLRDEHIAEVIIAADSPHPARREGLERMGATPAMVVGNTQWWRIPPGSPR